MPVVEFARKYGAVWTSLIALSGLFSTYTAFHLGYFSRVPSTHWVLLGSWSTSGMALQAAALFLVSGFMARFFVLGLHQLLSGPLLSFQLFEISSPELRAFKFFVLRTRRFFRIRRGLVTTISTGVLFSLLSFGLLDGILLIVLAGLVLVVVLQVHYPLFFRISLADSSLTFVIVPKRPRGVSYDRWIGFILTSAFMIVVFLSYTIGTFAYAKRIATGVYVASVDWSEAGSLVASSETGALFRFLTQDGDPEFRFVPYSAIQGVTTFSK